MQSFPITDLYRTINGAWLDTFEIPADRPVDGTFYNLRDQAEKDVHTIVQQNPESRAGALYSSFMDTEGIEQVGLDSLAADFEILSANTMAEFLPRLGDLWRSGVESFMEFFVAKDSGDDNAVVYAFQGGLGLPDEAYYREDTHAATVQQYQDHIGRMLQFLPEDVLPVNASTAAERIVALEKEIAAGHWDVVASRDAVRTYNPTDFAQLPQQVQTYLSAVKVPESRVIISQPSFFEHIASLLVDDRLEDFKLWILWSILRSRSHVLSPEISRANFDFYGTVLSGTPQQRDRWKRALGLASTYVGEEIGQLFVAEHFPPSSKKRMLELVDYLIEAYRERISALPWMSQDTRERALEKLELFTAKIGYPDQWMDYGSLDFSSSGTDLVDNVRKGSEFLVDYHLAKLGKPYPREEWVSTPQTVNAFYNPTVNDITFPAAILRPPFFDPEADAAENFGAIGAVIGHEIGHGFDDQGSQYDGHGDLNSWWTEEDRAAFSKLTAQLVEQFEGLVPQAVQDAGLETSGVKGEFTLGENIGDLGGLGIAIVAYKKYAADKGISLDETAVWDHDGALPEVSGKQFSGLQRLFFAWARVWRTAIRPEMAAQYLAIDPHSPAEFRCNVIAANVAEFYEAFEVAEDSPMWIAPDRRVTIW